ncbi:MAG: GatB/YqeY domain-containing protein [Deltaproteobacteria bacterium]|nr:MAG: GatB/YqeY domain-containing protein [Deltaproteobacteria bacterium]HEX16388.1 GatB/YqeY domain-containing protein [Deltaproteobacteria bacterium]
MAVLERIREEMKEAAKAGDRERLSILRYALAALQNKEKELRRSLKDEEVYQVLSSLIKKGREASEQFRKGGREDLAAKEEREVVVLESFLPERLSREELERMVDEAIEEVGAKGPRDLGKVMKILMPRVAGRAEGKLVSETVRKRLEGAPSVEDSP